MKYSERFMYQIDGTLYNGKAQVVFHGQIMVEASSEAEARAAGYQIMQTLPNVSRVITPLADLMVRPVGTVHVKARERRTHGQQAVVGPVRR